jgi:hypothetical protein
MRRKYSNDEVLARAKQGMALNLKELAIATGYGYSKVREWHDHGLPLIDGRITLADARAWLKSYHKTKRRECRASESDHEHHPLLAADKCG